MARTVELPNKQGYQQYFKLLKGIFPKQYEPQTSHYGERIEQQLFRVAYFSMPLEQLASVYRKEPEQMKARAKGLNMILFSSNKRSHRLLGVMNGTHLEKLLSAAVTTGMLPKQQKGKRTYVRGDDLAHFLHEYTFGRIKDSQLNKTKELVTLDESNRRNPTYYGYFEKIRSFDETIGLIQGYQQSVKNNKPRSDLFNIIYESNIKLVMNIAKRYINCGIQIEDLIGEGTLGLHKTIEKFDPKRGLAFSTYATWWIKQSIRRALTDKSRIIRVPVYMHTALTAEKIDKTNKVEAKKAETRERAKKIMEGVFSLNEEHMKSRVDKRKSIVENIGLKEAVEIVKNYMNKFSERKKRIVRHRLGGEVFNVDELTLNQLSEKLSLSRERVRQLQNEAVLALKDELTRKGF